MARASLTAVVVVICTSKEHLLPESNSGGTIAQMTSTVMERIKVNQSMSSEVHNPKLGDARK
jgi:hypothetical protein